MCRNASLKYWEIIADNLKKLGWSWGCVSAVDSNGRTIWIVDAHRGDGKRYSRAGMKSYQRFWDFSRRFAQCPGLLETVIDIV